MQKNMIIEQTEDGIPTLYLPRMDEHYHSTKGALAEAPPAAQYYIPYRGHREE